MLAGERGIGAGERGDGLQFQCDARQALRKRVVEFNGSAAFVSDITVTDCAAVGDAAITLSGTNIWVANVTVSNIVAGGSTGLSLSAPGVVTNCSFTHCLSTNAGTTVLAAASGTCQTFVDCVMSDNRVISPDQGYGAGMRLTNNKSGTVYADEKKILRRCVISNNYTTCYTSGGVSCGCPSEWYDCVISANSAGQNGGGSISGTGTIISNCVFSGNIARSYGCAGLYASGTGLLITDCTFADNMATGSIGGLSTAEGATIRNTLVVRNKSTSEPGAVNVESGCIIENVTVASNLCTASGVGGIKGEGSYFYNVVFADNYNRSGRLHTYAPGSHYYECHFDTGKATYCESDSRMTEGDPKFVDAAHGDYHFLHRSPLRDKGQNRDWMYGAKDLDGRSRIMGKSVDIGCYEYRPGGFSILLR